MNTIKINRAASEAVNVCQWNVLTAVRTLANAEKALTLRSGLRGGARTPLPAPTAGSGSTGSNHNQTGVRALDAVRKQAASEPTLLLRSGLRGGARLLSSPAGEGTGSGNHNQTRRR